MKNLKSYLEEDLKIDLSTCQFQELYSCSHLNGLSELLSTHFVILNESSDLIPLIPSTDCHKSVVDQCVLFLLTRKMYSNVLTHGYKLGGTTSINSALHCGSVNSNVAALKSKPWQLFHEIIGTQNFVNFIINCTVLGPDGDGCSQILGNRLTNPHHAPVSSHQSKANHNDLISPVRARSFLYKNYSRFNYSDILPPANEYVAFRMSVFNPCLRRMNRKMLSRIEYFLRKMLFNHHRKVKYVEILNGICPKSLDMGHLDAQTSTKQVIRFLIVILQKLIPPELFGSKRNKAVIFKYVSSMLMLPVKGSLDIAEIGNSLRLKDFSWLIQPNNQFVKHQYERTTFLMKSFISWLFRSLIPNIISTFFYCTEISSYVSISYFRHDVWNGMSLPYLNGYLERYMTENNVCRNHYSYLHSRFNHNKARVVPKKADGEFRIIAVPNKGADEEEYSAFRDNLRSVIYPIQCILDHLRNSRKNHFEKIYSANQIVSHIKKFKCHLLSKREYLPKLHYLKFDIDSCYDSIPRERVFSVIKKLLKKEHGFFVRSQSIYNSKTGAFSIQNVVNGSRQLRDEEVYIDNVRTSFISNKDLLNVLEDEVNNSVLYFNGKCYLRKDGLFQGTSLSALLVDLVYDDLLEYYSIFHPREEDDTLVLRLADDFLVISTNEARITNLKEAALQGFNEFNAKVNTNKVISSACKDERKEFSFCALQISIDDLEVTKSPESLNIPGIGMSSAAKILKRLLGLFEMRLSYGVTDLEINSKTTVLRQMRLIVTNIAEAYALACKGKRISTGHFSRFFHHMNLSAIRSCSGGLGNDMFSAQLRLVIAECFLTVLSRNHARFKHAIDYLKSDSRMLSADLFLN